MSRHQVATELFLEEWFPCNLQYVEKWKIAGDIWKRKLIPDEGIPVYFCVEFHPDSCDVSEAYEEEVVDFGIYVE